MAKKASTDDEIKVLETKVHQVETFKANVLGRGTRTYRFNYC